MNTNEKLWPSVMMLGLFLIAYGLHFLFVRDSLIPFFTSADFSLKNVGTCFQGFILFGIFMIITWQLTHFTIISLFAVLFHLCIRVMRK